MESQVLPNKDTLSETNPLEEMLKGEFWRAKFKTWGGYFPLTPAGVVLTLGLGAAVYYRGINQIDLVCIAAGGAMLLVLLIALVSVLLGFLIARRVIVEEEQPSFLDLASGKEVLSGFSIKFWSYIPLLHLNWRVDDFEAEVEVESHKGRLRERITCHRRGLRDGLLRKFTISDTLGLAAMSWYDTEPGRVRVLPNPGRLDQPNILLSLVSGEDLSDPRGDPEGDRVDMRQYQKGDPMKFILWKVYSRSGKVMVRVPERALAARPRACAYLLAGPDDEATAALARVLLEMKLLGEGWRFGADGREGYTSELDEALNSIARSGNIAKADSQGLQKYLAQAEEDGYGFCLVLAPPANKVVAKAVIDSLNKSGLKGEIWIGLDLEESDEEHWFKALQLLEEKPLSPKVIHKNWEGYASLVERGTGRVMARSRGGIK